MSDTPKCPRCGSRNTGTSLDYKIKKGLSYAGEFAIGYGAGYFLGEAGGELVSDVNLHDKVEKEYECSDCGYKWQGSGRQTSISASKQHNQSKKKVSPQEYSRTELLVIIAHCDNNNGQYSENSIIKSSPKDLRIALQDCGIQISSSAIGSVNTYRGLIDYILERTTPNTNPISRPKPSPAQLMSTGLPQKSIVEPFVLPIEDKFNIEGRGTVVCGRIATGKVAVNDELLVVNPSGNKYKTACIGIEMFQKLLPQAEEGDNCGILIRNVPVSVIQEGAWLQRGEGIVDISYYRSLVEMMNDAIKTHEEEKSSDNSSDEQEYVEMYKEYAADGEISERDQKMLDKFRSRLGISVERARELEESCSKPKLTEDEQEYLEMIKEYAADGEISERDRKMLNKMRDRMGISEERAKEIEKL